MENLAKIIDTLEAYNGLTKIENNHAQLLKEKTIILYVATLLETRNLQVLHLCLGILENFIQNEKSHEILMCTFGIFEALESLSIRLRHESNALSRRASEMVDILRSSAPPAYSTRNRSKKHRAKTTFVYLLQFDELTGENRRQLEDVLVRIKGITSFVIDLEHKRYTIRLGPKTSIKQLVGKIELGCGFRGCLVTRNADKNETLIDILSETNSTSPYPEHYPDDDSPPKRNALNTLTGMQQNTSSWMKSVKSFCKESFYW